MVKKLTDRQTTEARAAFAAGYRPIDVIDAVARAQDSSHADAYQALCEAGVKAPPVPGSGAFFAKKRAAKEARKK